MDPKKTENSAVSITLTSTNHNVILLMLTLWNLMEDYDNADVSNLTEFYPWLVDELYHMHEDIASMDVNFYGRVHHCQFCELLKLPMVIFERGQENAERDLQQAIDIRKRMEERYGPKENG